MNLLAFDTSTEAMSLAVQRTDVGVAGAGPSVQCWLHSGPGGALTSTLLIPAIQQLMTQAGLQFPQLDAIVFGCGPGTDRKFNRMRPSMSRVWGHETRLALAI